MKVAVSIVRMMEMSVYQVVHVIAMRNRHVATRVAMLERRVVSAALTIRSAIGRIRC